MKGEKMHEIYEKYSKLVYNYLFSLTKNVEISQELMQETFYCAVKNIKKFKGECSVKTWLLKIAQNKWKDYLKSTKNKHFLSYDANSLKEEELLQQPSLELETFEKERLFLLYQLIHRLDENTREVIYLRLKSELSFKDIGKILDKTEQWARVTFYRGKQKLKEELKNEGF